MSNTHLQSAARSYYQNVQALRAGKVTADEHRAVNRRLRESVGDQAWERVKIMALSTDQRLNG